MEKTIKVNKNNDLKYQSDELKEEKEKQDQMIENVEEHSPKVEYFTE